MALRSRETTINIKPYKGITDAYGAVINGYGETHQVIGNIYRETSEMSLKMYGNEINAIKRVITPYPLNLKDGVYIDNSLDQEPDFEVVDVQLYFKHTVALLKKKVM